MTISLASGRASRSLPFVRSGLVSFAGAVAGFVSFACSCAGLVSFVSCVWTGYRWSALPDNTSDECCVTDTQSISDHVNVGFKKQNRQVKVRLEVSN